MDLYEKAKQDAKAIYRVLDSYGKELMKEYLSLIKNFIDTKNGKDLNLFMRGLTIGKEIGAHLLNH